MSDDTPTQKFDPMGDAPTEIIGGPPVPPADAAGPVGENGKSRRLLIILASVGGALLLAVLILLVLLLTRGGGTPAPSESPTPTPTPSSTPSVTPSPSPTPTPTPTETTPPPPPPPSSPISTYSASQSTVDCSGGGSVPVTFSWAATGQTLWFGVGTDNAKLAPYDQYPLNYTLDFQYQCGQAGGQQKYTITVESATGDVNSRTIVIKEN